MHSLICLLRARLGESRFGASIALTLVAAVVILSTALTELHAEEGKDFKQIENRIKALIHAAGDDAIVAVAYHDLETGEELLIKAADPFHPASTIKVAVMMEVYRRAREGTLSLDDRVTLRNEFRSIADGSKYVLYPKDDSELTLYKRVGGEATVRELVWLMITESSNLATNLLVERVTPTRATEFMRQLGAEEVVVLRGVEDGPAYAQGLNNKSTARGLMKILLRLAERSAVSPSDSDAMLAVLRGQKFKEGIPAGLPPSVSVAHKTGSFKSVYHDVAIVEPPKRKPYVLVVLTRGIAEEKRAHQLVADISQLIFDRATTK